MKRGKFVVVYGMNNLGKTTMTKSMVEELRKRRINASYLKYPLYDLEPTGPRINAYLRGGNSEGFSPLAFQELMVQNRRDYEAKLEERLEDGEWIIAEDYKGTGILWGVIFGCELEEMERINQNLLEPDLSILLDGDRLLSGVEQGHRHESISGEEWNRGREIAGQLALRYGWEVQSSIGGNPERMVRNALDLIYGRFYSGPEGNRPNGRERQ